MDIANKPTGHFDPCERWKFHDTTDPLTRYLRDRRLNLALSRLLQLTNSKAESWGKALVVCGGVGGEGTLLRKLGFQDVTVSELDPALIKIMEDRDPNLRGVVCDAERLPFENGSFEIVLVQDGIHHLKNPALGITEMLRVASRAVIVIEPHKGIVAELFGTKIENEGKDPNFVFRWNRGFFIQVVSSFLVGAQFQTYTLRFWDHSLAMLRLFRWIPVNSTKLLAIRASYGFLDTVMGFLGNMFVGVVIRR